MNLRRLALSGFWIGVYLAVTMAPLLVMLAGPTPPGRGFWRELSVGFGFAGLSMMGMQFFLTGRFASITSPYGIDVVYHFHRNISLIASFFILIHPVILIADSPEILAVMTSLDMPPRMAAGIASILGFAVVVLSSLYRMFLGLSYERWRIIHAYVSVFAIAAALAHLVGVGYYTGVFLKKAVWVTLACAWIFALVYVRIIKQAGILRRPYTVSSVKKERGNSWTLTLEPSGHGGMSFSPGQFAWLTLDRSPFSIKEHPFSFSSSAIKHGGVQMTIKELGDFTSVIGTVKPGTRAYLDGPYGTFSIDGHPAPGYVFIAGGVGITPVISILRTMADRNDRRPVSLIYGSKTWEDVTFREELDELKKRLDLDVVHVLGAPHPGWEGESGFVAAELLARRLPRERMDYGYLICGPEPMQRAVRKALASLGIPTEKVQYESFNFV